MFQAFTRISVPNSFWKLRTWKHLINNVPHTFLADLKAGIYTDAIKDVAWLFLASIDCCCGSSASTVERVGTTAIAPIQHPDRLPAYLRNWLRRAFHLHHAARRWKTYCVTNESTAPLMAWGILEGNKCVRKWRTNGLTKARKYIL